MIERFAENPLLTPADAVASRPDMTVSGVFNPGAARLGEDTILLVRVAERPVFEPGFVASAALDPEAPGKIAVRRFSLTDPELDARDPRFFVYRGRSYPTSLSHLRLARSADGRNFELSPVPTLFPAGENEAFGIEDARLLRVGEWYYVSYVAVSERGALTRLARTKDFAAFERLGTLFPPDNKDVALFPAQAGGRHWALHRPCTEYPGIWIASSADMLDWGGHRFLLGTRAGMWDGARVGGGAEPLLTERGWLALYHGAALDADGRPRYALGAALLDANEPWKVSRRAEKPFLTPEGPAETEGFMPNVLFNNGLVDRGDGTVDLYYGAADERVCGARLDLAALLKTL